MTLPLVEERAIIPSTAVTSVIFHFAKSGNPRTFSSNSPGKPPFIFCEHLRGFWRAEQSGDGYIYNTHRSFTSSDLFCWQYWRSSVCCFPGGTSRRSGYVGDKRRDSLVNTNLAIGPKRKRRGSWSPLSWRLLASHLRSVDLDLQSPAQTELVNHGRGTPLQGTRGEKGKLFLFRESQGQGHSRFRSLSTESIPEPSLRHPTPRNTLSRRRTNVATKRLSKGQIS